jgi:hypothetical protein
MDLNAVYKKTQKGLEEMAQRTVLGMRERTLLVMVDGKTTAADLLARAQHMPDPQGLLQKLIDGGFIASDAPAAPAAAPLPAPAAAPAAPAAPTASVAAAPPRTIQEVMRYAQRFLYDNLGPDGDSMSEAIERCKTLPELKARLEKTRDALQDIGKKRKADEFWSGVELRLPPA